MRALLPSPALSLVLLVLWLLLNDSVHPAHLLLGVLLAVVIPRLTHRFWPERVRLRRPLLALRLVLRVLGDIVVANVQVARRILGPEAAIRPRFVRVPIDLANGYALTTLALIISLTPGTLSADLEDDRRHLLVHAFDVEDEQRLIRTIKRRYEAPLAEIFA